MQLRPALLFLFLPLITRATQTAPPTSLRPGTYQVNQIVTGAAVYNRTGGKLINNFGQIIGRHLLSTPPYVSGFLWTPATANGTTGIKIDLPIPIPEGMNDHGQVVGQSPAALWTPNAANGTSGVLTTLVDPPSTAYAINGVGQIVGSVVPASPYLWNPVTVNGTSGVFYSGIGGLAAINDFGQIVMQGFPFFYLFTPSMTHGTTGTSTPFTGIGSPLSINNNGAILSANCTPFGFACMSSHGYVWTPSSPNSTTGTVSEIPLPPGFSFMEPTAINSRGDVVGYLTAPGGSVTPFLYSGGTMYDLSTVSSQLIGSRPSAINDRGQIVINVGSLPYNSSTTVHLLTPRPQATVLSPRSGSGYHQSMTFTFTDGAGWDDLNVVNILINNALDGRYACYLAYSRPTNQLYLLDDLGEALLPGLPLGSAGMVSNSQCSVSGLGSFFTGSGIALTLTLNLDFNAGFAGNKIVYLAARDGGQGNSGWQAMGAWTVPGGAPPAIAAPTVTPAEGSGFDQTFTFTFTDTKGWQDIGVANILVNNFLDGRNACYLAYSRSFGILYLVKDAGGGLYPGFDPNGGGTASNAQCTVSGGPSSAVGSGNTLTLTVSLHFSSSFSGNRVIYAATRDNMDVNTSFWQPVGAWTVGP